MLQLDVRLGEIWGFSPLIFVRGHFYEIGIAALLFRLKARHVEKFRKFRFADVGKVCLEKKKKKHAQNIRSTVHRTGDLIIPTHVMNREIFAGRKREFDGVIYKL